MYKDCPLWEIVQLHDCIRGELRTLQSRVTRLRAATGEVLRSDGRYAYSVASEVQIRSQVQMLYAVFQAHSTAEDEIIWPALKALLGEMQH